jgi:hypothetical protein
VLGGQPGGEVAKQPVGALGGQTEPVVLIPQESTLAMSASTGTGGGNRGAAGGRPQCPHILAELQRRAEDCWPLPTLVVVPTVVWTRHRSARAGGWLSEHAAVAEQEGELLWAVANGVEFWGARRRRRATWPRLAA